MTTLVSLQTVLKSALDMQIVELKTLMERASQLTPQKLSLSSSPRGNPTSQERTRVIRIVPTGVRLPLGVEIEQAGFIKIDLEGIPLESFQLVQTQVQEEMRERELLTYAHNEKLRKENDQLQAQNKSISKKMAQKEEEEHRLMQAIEYLLRGATPLQHPTRSFIVAEGESYHGQS